MLRYEAFLLFFFPVCLAWFHMTLYKYALSCDLRVCGECSHVFVICKYFSAHPWWELKQPFSLCFLVFSDQHPSLRDHMHHHLICLESQPQKRPCDLMAAEDLSAGVADRSSEILLLFTVYSDCLRMQKSVFRLLAHVRCLHALLL